MSAARRILKILRAIAGGIVIDPPAFNYNNVQGAIYDQEWGAYDAETGQIFVSDPGAAVTPQWGGSYDNRQ